MEGEKVKAIVMVMLFMGIIEVESRASFKICFEGCFIDCSINNSSFGCAAKCLIDCIIQNTTSDVIQNTHDWCTLGCASSLCTHFSTKKNPNEEKVESCANSCSEKCTKNYLSP
ncbi:unnamed protein product [Camellia sinensis]